MKIGIENFRIFEDHQKFDIRPITILTGPNNSGKSALSKLLKLLSKNADELDTRLDAEHNLGNFDNMINRNSEEKEFRITVPTDTAFFPPTFETEIIYRDGRAAEITISDIDAEILVAEKHHYEGAEKVLRGSFNYRYLLDLLSERNIFFKNRNPIAKPAAKYISYKELNDFIPFKPYETYKSDLPGFEFKEYFSYLNNLDEGLFSEGLKPDTTNYEEDSSFEVWPEDLKQQGLELQKKQDEHDLYFPHYPKDKFIGEGLGILAYTGSKITDQSYLLFDVFSNGENITEKFKEIIIEQQDKLLQDFEIVITRDFENSIDLLIHETLQGQLKKIKSYLYGRLREDYGDIEITENETYKLLFEEEILSGNEKKITVLQELCNQTQNLKFMLSDIHFIDSTVKLNKRRYSLEKYEPGDPTENLQAFAKKDDNRKTGGPKKYNDQFLKAFLKLFEIDGELDIKMDDLSITPLLKMADGTEIYFADLGLGYGKIFPIVLEICKIDRSGLFFRKNPLIFVVEEPENHLHPNFQSKLADFFELITYFYPNVKIIVDTHSEYLVRKLQLLTKDGFPSRNSIIYYYNHDNQVTYSEPKVKKIEINKDGLLSSNFGKGFFDEALELRYKLF